MSATFSFIGTGNMGGALARAVCAAVGPENLLLYDLDSAKAEAMSFEKAAVSGAAAARTAKINPAQQYEQRKYDDEAMKKRVAVDFSELSGDEEE